MRDERTTGDTGHSSRAVGWRGLSAAWPRNFTSRVVASLRLLSVGCGVSHTATDQPSQQRWGWRPSLLPIVLLLPFALLTSDAPGGKHSESIGRGKRQIPQLLPFLEVFMANTEPPVVMDQVKWTGPFGERTGYLARQQSDERLPALLLISGAKGFDDWLLRSARELGEVGYVVLTVEGPGAAARERGLADLSADVRWLRRRDDVFADRVGALGWSSGGDWALAVATASGLEGAVLCDAKVSLDDAALAGLRHTAVMGIWSGQRAQQLGEELLGAFGRTLESAEIVQHLLVFDEAKRGFMRPENAAAYRYDDAERAWFEIYEFLGAHVEDAAIKKMLAQRKSAELSPRPGVATISDLMRAVNAPTGVRGQLAQSLADEPADDKSWAAVRARAAVLVETAGLLERHTPPNGTTSSWFEHVQSYRDAAEGILRAADGRDFGNAIESLKQVNLTCGACHLEHR